MESIQTSRRTFLKLSAIAGLGTLGIASLNGCAPENNTQKPPASTLEEIAWDGYFDVVVIGFGAAGASAAIAAAEAGAQVLIVDKAHEGHEGGNSRYCAQLFVSVNDVD